MFIVRAEGLHKCIERGGADGVGQVTVLLHYSLAVRVQELNSWEDNWERMIDILPREYWILMHMYEVQLKPLATTEVCMYSYTSVFFVQDDLLMTRIRQSGSHSNWHSLYYVFPVNGLLIALLSE